MACFGPDRGRYSVVILVNNDKNTNAFFELLNAGLWEKNAQLSEFEGVDFKVVSQIAEYQSVEGLIAAGLEHLQEKKVRQDVALSFAGVALQLEQRNQSMNEFLRQLIERLRKKGIYALLVKGQEVAQCYERPLWRACGDVDLFLSDDNYKKARAYLIPLASSVENEEQYKKHQALTIDGWVVELHGNLHSSLSRSVEKELDIIYMDSFYHGSVRSWMNKNTQIFLLSAENDVFYVFTHILQHYFHGGIGLRQICDWCRLLWTYREIIDTQVLEKRIKVAKLQSEWKAFACFVVSELGMPAEAMPLYDATVKWRKKALRIKALILQSGNFGHRDLRYVKEMSYVGRKMRSLKGVFKELKSHFRTFPWDSIKFFMYYVGIRLTALGRGE